MFTISYKTAYIHGYCDRDECKVQLDNYSILGVFRSVRAAKIAITRHVRFNHADV
jgi:hypothetical protein